MNNSSPRSIIGLVLIVLGLGFLSDQLGLANIFGFGFGDLIGSFWPLIIVFLGVWTINKGNYTVGIFVLFAGMLLQFSTLFDFSFWGLFWPLIIVWFGFRLLYKESHGEFRGTMSGTSNQEYLNDSIIFWGVEKKVVSDNFSGGKINCYFGGAEVDLRGAKISSEGAVLEINCAFGGVELYVSPEQRVVVQGDAILGGWENHFQTSTDEGVPTLTIKGMVSFGGVEIKN